MYSLLNNKERNVLLPVGHQENSHPYEEVYAKMAEEFNEELHRYSGTISEFRMALMNHIDSLMNLYEEI